ncbi:MAG: site-specific DNA-methyltransferase [Anaerolineae bacterium]|nr:site-specific DNA-methyltransferase [Anaerolineae bacterium]
MNQDQVSKTSINLAKERSEQLSDLFPEAFREGQLDLEALKAALGLQTSDTKTERFSFTWAGKRDAIRLAQTPSRATLIPSVEESINWDTTSNAFIEGDNLEVLKLIGRSYFGRVKMIYIDPPYNTGNDFVYPDNYSDPLETYLHMTGQTDTNGNRLTSNAESNGRYHSAWLSMMYPRLVLARQFLKEDGIIFISIDDHEVHNLRQLMNEIFGEESLLACFIWHRRQMSDSRNQDRASTDHEYVLAYRRPSATLQGRDVDLSKYNNPNNDPRGDWFSADLTGLANKEQRPNLHYDIANPETEIVYHPSVTRGWSVSKTTFERLIQEGRIIWPSKPDGRPRVRKYLNEREDFKTGFSTILDVGFTTEGTREIQSLFGDKIIQFPKPVSLIKTLIAQATSQYDSDIVMDFFAGSSTTAQAVYELNGEDGGNRRYVLVQLPEPTDNPTFPTIADIGKERIRRVIDKIEKSNGKLLRSSDDLGFRVFKLTQSNYRQWQPTEDAGEIVQQLELMADSLLVAGWKPENVIFEVAVKEGYGLNIQVEQIDGLGDSTVYRVTDSDKAQHFLICLDDQLPADLLIQLGLTQDDLFICLDSALNDTLAANFALQARLKTL